MHDTVAKTFKRILDEGPRPGLAETVALRLQDVGLARALTAPLSSRLDVVYRESVHWLRLVNRLTAGESPDKEADVLSEVVLASRRIATGLEELEGFLERAEDNLGDREEITHRETAYEREVAPFSRLDSTKPFRDYLTERLNATPRLAGEGAQAQADLLKLVYLEKRMSEGAPKPADLYAMILELQLDTRRHLLPAFDESAPLMGAMRAAAGH